MATRVISVGNVTVGESDGFAIFTVTLDGPSTSVVSVSYNDASGTAVAPTDFLGVSGTLTFAPGETVKTVQVPIVDAASAVPKGDFFLNLFNPANAVIGNTTALATIIANDEPSGTPVMSIDSPVVDATAAQVTFAVTLNRPSTGTVTVNYTTAAGSDKANDFTPASGTLSFAPGETEKNVTVLLTNGTTPQPEETFNLVLSGVSGATLPNAVGTALIGPSNQPTVVSPEISVANITVSESDAYAEFVVRLNASSTSVVSVSYNDASGTAVAPTDFLDDIDVLELHRGGPGDRIQRLAGLGVSGTLTFAPGETLKTVRVPIVDDLSETDVEAFSFNLFNPVHATIATPSATATIEPICFLRGTLIATPNGEIPVERLAVGDLVLTLHGETKPVVWIGSGRVLATRGRRSAATPVIVRKGALADNVPCRNLRVTKGHSLYIDNVLIPVEFLVNHRSIIWDDHAQEVTIYHVELETHDVLIANGAAAESYRDDGNRWLFQNSNNNWALTLPPKEPCAPVLTGGPIVDDVWRRLLDRAGQRAGMPITDDADLHLLIDGQRVEAASHIGPWYTFRLVARPISVRIISRASAPQELGLTRDPRPLGVALKQIVVTQGALVRTIEAHDEALAKGFHGFEPDMGIRWTDGDAAVPTTLFADLSGSFELALHLVGTAHYVVADSSRRAA